MKLLLCIIFYFLFSIIIVATDFFNEEPIISISEQFDITIIIPLELESSLIKYFPSYRIRSKHDFFSTSTDSYDIFELHLNSFGSNSIPWMCWADFNQDKNLDYVLILEPIAGGNSILVVFHYTEEGFKPHFLVDNLIDDDVTIATGGRTHYEGLVVEDDLVMSIPYIRLIKWDSHELLFFYHEGFYKKAWYTF